MSVLQTALLHVRGGMSVGEQATFIVYVAAKRIMNDSRRAHTVQKKDHQMLQLLFREPKPLSCMNVDLPTRRGMTAD